MAALYDPRLPITFWHRVKVVGKCWIWQAGTDPYGYGRFYHQGRHHSAHKFAYIALVGPVTAGYELDHTCRHRDCCNPDCLEQVTHRVNVLRGECPAAHHARQTECKRGHPFDEANTIHTSLGKRYCRTCKNDHSRETYARRRAAALG